MAEGWGGSSNGWTRAEAAIERAKEEHRSPDRFSEHKHASMLARLELHRALADSQAMLMALCEHDENLKDAEITLKGGGRVILTLNMEEVLNANSTALALARRDLDAD